MHIFKEEARVGTGAWTSIDRNSKAWIMRIATVVVLTAALLQPETSSFAQADPWPGVYLNQASGTRLRILPKSSGGYPCEFMYETLTFPARGRVVSGTFTGEYLFKEQWFPFTVAPDRGAFSLTVDGVTVPVERLTSDMKSTTAPPKGTPPVSTSPPKTGPAAIEGKENAAWTQRLRGRQLLFLQTLGGGTAKATVNLYADGRYTFESSSSYSSGGYGDFSYADSESDEGVWKVVDRQGVVVLSTLSTKNGRKAEMRVQPGASAGQVLIDGRRFFIQEIPR